MDPKSNGDDILAKLGRRKIPKSRRLALREPPYDEATAAVVGNAVFQGLSPVNLRMSLANHPKLAAAFQAMSHIVMFQTAVAERDREIAIIRTGALTRSEYEWGMHVSIFGEKCGLTPEQVEDVTLSESWRDLKAGLWNEREQLVVRMVDELHHHSTIADETWAQLTKHYPNDQVIELIFSSSFYHMAAFYLNSTAVPLEEGAQRFPNGLTQASV
ncbi:MAG TPA: carboxymuconolactone decarboxylase family protein [Hyphomicrobiaceae bacterium]